MRSVNIAELKDHLSAYVTYVKNGETVVIRDRNRPVARMVPFLVESASDQELELAARGLMLLPEQEIRWDEFLKLPIANSNGISLTQLLLDERVEGR